MRGRAVGKGWKVQFEAPAVAVVVLRNYFLVVARKWKNLKPHLSFYDRQFGLGPSQSLLRHARELLMREYGKYKWMAVYQHESCHAEDGSCQDVYYDGKIAHLPAPEDRLVVRDLRRSQKTEFDFLLQWGVIYFDLTKRFLVATTSDP